MKVRNAIEEADTLKVNMYPTEIKIKWLRRLELRIKREIIDTHKYNEGEEEITVPDEDGFDLESDLIVGEPWSEMYVHWLEAQIDYNNMEYDGFNAANAMFESVFESFRNAYNEEHMPYGCGLLYF